jgi:hypothetical protein
MPLNSHMSLDSHMPLYRHMALDNLMSLKDLSSSPHHTTHLKYILAFKVQQVCIS